MSNEPRSVVQFARELRRRRVFRTAGLYIVGAWVVMQVADVVFPAWGLPNAAVRVLLITAILCFPLALVFGWFYDITVRGIVRATPGTANVKPGLQRNDYIILSALALIAAVFVFDAVRNIVIVSNEPVVDDRTGFAVNSSAPPHSIAVLPFANISDEPANDAFCDGLSEEILHRLAEFKELHVIARTSSFAFKNSDYQVPRIAGILGVRYLLQGSVRRAGKRLRISAQLVDHTGAQRWSDRFDRELGDIFNLQTEIADLVATTIVPQITMHHDSMYEPRIEAYVQFLVGRELLHARRVTAARAKLALAVELDPNFAEAHAEYAIAIGIWDRRPETLELAQRAIDEALRLRPRLPRALAARALFLADTKPAAAVGLLREVLAAEPNMADAHNWMANALASQDKHDEALRLRERTALIDPLHAANTANLATEYQRRGAFDDAEAVLLRYGLQPNPSLMVVGSTAHFYRTTGQLPEALAQLRRTAEIANGIDAYPGFGHLLLAEFWAVLGNTPAAEAQATEGRTFPAAAGSLDWPAWVELHVMPAAWRGDYAGALEALRALPGASDAANVASALGCLYGYLASLAGEHAQAIEWLRESGSTPDNCTVGSFISKDIFDALAWAYLQAGRRHEAQSILDARRRTYEQQQRDDRLNHSEELYSFAVTLLLSGEPDAALRQLQNAIDAGWREVYLHSHDPRWASLRDDPLYENMMAWVKADIDRQAAAMRNRVVNSGH